MLKKVLIQVLTILVSASLLTVSIAGVIIQRDLDIYKKVSKFVVRPYKYGLYITQPDSGIFYNFSPYNDYALDSTNDRVLHTLYFDQEITSDESGLLYSRIQTPKRALLSALYYLRLATVSATFRLAGGTTLVYKLLNNPYDPVTICADGKLPSGSGSLHRTISYNEDDVIFDQSGKVYTYISNLDLTDFNKLYGQVLTLSSTPESTESSEYTGVSKIFIFNKQLSGILGVESNTTRQKLYSLDRDKKLLDFVTSTQPCLQLHLYSNVMEGINEL